MSTVPDVVAVSKSAVAERSVEERPEPYDFSDFGGFSSPNWTPVPDELLDHVMQDLTGGELRTLLYIIRRTSGFKKRRDAITLAQMTDGLQRRDGTRIDRGVGLARSPLCRVLTSLEEKGLINREQRMDPDLGHLATVYSLRLRDDPCDQEVTRNRDREVTPPRDPKGTTTRDSTYERQIDVPPNVGTSCATGEKKPKVPAYERRIAELPEPVRTNLTAIFNHEPFRRFRRSAPSLNALIALVQEFPERPWDAEAQDWSSYCLREGRQLTIGGFRNSIERHVANRWCPPSTAPVLPPPVTGESPEEREARRQRENAACFEKHAQRLEAKDPAKAQAFRTRMAEIQERQLSAFHATDRRETP